MPGMNRAAGEPSTLAPGRRVALHHMIKAGNRGYGAWRDGGFTVHDLSDPTNVAFIGGPADGGTYYYGFVPAAPTCTADDIVSGFNHCTVGGYGTGVGGHTLTATAYDNAGRSASATRTYTVSAWTLKGFYSNPAEAELPERRRGGGHQLAAQPVHASGDHGASARS